MSKTEKRVDDAREKRLRADHVFVSPRSVEEAAVMVIDPPFENVVPLIVPSEPVSRFVPMDEVAITCPAAFVERSALVRPVMAKVEEVAFVKSAFPKVAGPLTLSAARLSPL